MNRKNSVKQTVTVAFFAAMIFLGIQTFRIPVPAAIGTPFLHFAHIFVMLAILCMGGFEAACAGLVGFVIFDLLNGYAASIPNVLFSTLVTCLTVGVMYPYLEEKAGDDRKKRWLAAVKSAILYGVLNVLIDLAWSTYSMVMLGSKSIPALFTALASVPATVVNSIFTVIGVAVLYVPVVGAYRRIVKE